MRLGGCNAKEPVPCRKKAHYRLVRLGGIGTGRLMQKNQKKDGSNIQEEVVGKGKFHINVRRKELPQGGYFRDLFCNRCDYGKKGRTKARP